MTRAMREFLGLVIASNGGGYDAQGPGYGAAIRALLKAGLIKRKPGRLHTGGDGYGYVQTEAGSATWIEWTRALAAERAKP